MIELLRENPLLLLFVVTALGYAVGQIEFLGIRLGSAAVLFVGLFFGGYDANLTLPAFVIQLGLVIFVYAIGLNNGSNFFRALREEGVRQLAFIMFFLTLPAVLLVGFFLWLDFTPGAMAGVFSGVGTSTAGLAATLDLITATLPPTDATNALAATAIAFAIGYPIGVLGRILIITGLQTLWKIDFQAEALSVRDLYPMPQEIINQAIEVTNPEMTNIPLRQLQRDHNWDVIFGRLYRNDHISLVTGETHLHLGDIIFLAGEIDNIEAVIQNLGQPADNNIFIEQSIYVKRRLFVSNPDVVGQSIAALDLKERFGALITRVRRGDTDLLGTRDIMLELGDRVRVLARRTDMPEVIDLFGDSYRAVSQVNLLSFGFGITFGLLLGLVSITLPGGATFQIGSAGGTLIIALILGAVRRTGSIVWTLPYSATQALQQIGLIFLLAAIGVRSGNALENLALGNTVLLLVFVSVAVVLTLTTVSLIIGHKIMGMPFSLVAGMIASQPAVYSYLSERAKTHLPNIGFTMAIPLGVIFKVLYAQLLYSILSRL